MKPFLVLLGLINLAVVMALDTNYWQRDILSGGLADFSSDHVARSAVIFLSVIAIFGGLVNQKNPKSLFAEKKRHSWEKKLVLGTLSIAGIIVILLTLFPSSFNIASKEDGLIEWSSAILLFASTIVFIISWTKWRIETSIPKISKFFLLLMAFVFFVIAMEEVSWFQRVLNFETPEVFAANSQSEANFHNLATIPVEYAYYFGSFLFLVVFPYLRFFYMSADSNYFLKTFVPRPYIAIAGAIATAYNFDSWNVIFTQIALFGSLTILAVFFIYSIEGIEKRTLAFSIFLIIFSQVIFFTAGDKYRRPWTIKEYKEFLIPIALFIYSLDVFLINIRNSLAQKKNGAGGQLVAP